MHILDEWNKLENFFYNEGVDIKFIQYDYKILWGYTTPELWKKDHVQPESSKKV